MSEKAVAEHGGDESCQQAVAGHVTGPVGGLLLMDARRHHHVQPVLQQPGDHRRRAGRIIGRVAVHQHVDVGIDVGKHPPHHVALALMRLPPDDGAGRARDLDGAVGRVVVVDVDGRLRQGGAEIAVPPGQWRFPH